MFRRRRATEESGETSDAAANAEPGTADRADADRDSADLDSADLDSADLAQSAPGGPRSATGGVRSPTPVDWSRSDGPFDESEIEGEVGEGRIDLGGLWMPGVPGMDLRVQIDPETETVSSVAAVIAQSALEVQAFAAPRSSGIWDDVRGEIAEGIRAQGGEASETDGPCGTELRALLPAQLPDGSVGRQSVRFLGVDGPRWFLRGVVSGEAAVDAAAAGTLEEVFRGIVVVRGLEAMAPRDPIPLRLPTDADVDKEATGEADDDAGDDAGDDSERDPLQPFERGPEITEIR